MAGGYKYVLGVDEDEVSAYAFQWAVKNIFRAGDSLLLLTATFSDASLPSADLTAGEYAIPTPMVASPDAAAEISARATTLVGKYMRLAQDAGLKSEGKVVEGSPGPHIVSEAERFGADAIVLGTHGRGVIGRTLLGSISDYVRHHSALPVVVVRFPKAGEKNALETHEEKRKVVAALDESPEASHAFTWALQRFVREEDNLLVLHVQNPLAQPTAIGTDQLGMEDVYVPPDTSNKINVEALGVSEKLVEVFMKQASDISKAHCEGRVVQGSTQDKITQELQVVKADVVVVGSRNQDALQRTFLGSVSDYLAHNSPCPLIFVKLVKNTGDGSGKAHDV